MEGIKKPEKPPKLIPAVRHKGETHTGANHGEIADRLWPKDEDVPDDAEDGFVIEGTDTFMSRKEAYEWARERGLLKGDAAEGPLSTEDLKDAGK